MRAVVDIETDAINATKIHCIVARRADTGETRHWIGDQCLEFGEWSKKIDTFIMHNGISFDAPLLNKFTGSDIKVDQIDDTLIKSQLYNPIRDGGHSLESWGNFFNHKKGDYHDFSHFNQDMLKYCYTDTAVTMETYDSLQDEVKKFSEEASDLERKLRISIDQQQDNCCVFNTATEKQLDDTLMND